MTTLGIDVGFAALGWCVFDDADRLVSLGTIVTVPFAGESASDGLMRRSREIAREIRLRCAVHRPHAIVMEAVSWPRSGSVIGKMGAAYGAVGAAIGCEAPTVLVRHISPQQVRKALGLAKGADKDALWTAVREHPGCERLDQLLMGVRTKALRQHPIDACAVVLASRALALQC